MYQTKQNDDSSLLLINAKRKQICEKLNTFCKDVIALEAGRENVAEHYFNKMLEMIDVATMLDIITNNEREEFYQKTYDFFSGIKITEFCLNELNTHHFEEYNILDLVLVYKINMQEKMNQNLQLYRTEIKGKGDTNSSYLQACSAIINFGKVFSILQDTDIKMANSVIAEHKKGKVKNLKILFVPEKFYSLI